MLKVVDKSRIFSIVPPAPYTISQTPKTACADMAFTFFRN